MRILQPLLLSFFLSFLTGCKKENNVVTCPQQNYYNVSNLINQFNFKKNSYWVLKNSNSNNTDTLKVHFSTGLLKNTGTSKECDGDVYYSYQNELHHSMLLNGATSMIMSGTNVGVSTSYYKYCTCNQLSFFEKNSGDSIPFNNDSNWSKIETIYSNIIINGHTYTNVYQMFYYPDLYGFKRIWWCPEIGYIKFEYFNNSTSQTEYWELDSYNVQLY